MRLESVYKLLSWDSQRTHTDDSVSKESETPRNLSLNHGNSSHRASVIRREMVLYTPHRESVEFIPADQDKSELRPDIVQDPSCLTWNSLLCGRRCSEWGEWWGAFFGVSVHLFNLPNRLCFADERKQLVVEIVSQSCVHLFAAEFFYTCCALWMLRSLSLGSTHYWLWHVCQDPGLRIWWQLPSPCSRFLRGNSGQSGQTPRDLALIGGVLHQEELS